MPNYGYDWPLPFVRGETEARTIGNVEAVQIAIQNGAEIRFDDVARSPYFEYLDESGTEHVVWFEDARSIRDKYALLPEYGLKGIGVWQIMRWFRGMWLAEQQSGRFLLWAPAVRCQASSLTYRHSRGLENNTAIFSVSL